MFLNKKDMSKKNQSKRLTNQHKKSEGVIGIFGDDAKMHDLTVGKISKFVMNELQEEYPQLTFRYRTSIRKKEINKSLKRIDSELGQTLFVLNSSIKPDGGIIEVKDDNDEWRVVLVPEAKSQGKDIENIKNGLLVGKLNNQDLMVAGNAIERSHKNINEIRNFMISESHFPYVLFLEGSNFLTENTSVETPDGRIVNLSYNLGSLNRLDRLTAANYGMPINTNLCENKFLTNKNGTIRSFQSASIYTKGDGNKWDNKEMFDIMKEISKTSLKLLGSDLTNQISKK
jgi:type II restriction enzyme